MLNKQDNELMCRVGAGTAMGNAMRRYWIPALQSSDLPDSDADPKPIELLGEQLIAWRDASGKVGLYAEGCLHRGASLSLARAEGDGLRCIYHGWKFAVDGAVLDTPNVADPRFKDRVKGRTYPVREAGGLIWAYLGPAEAEPDFPKWPWLDLPAANRINAYAVVGCNYVQVIEGLVDSSHLSILHTSGLQKTTGNELDFAKKTNHMQFDAAPRIEAEETEFGFHYAALRSVGDEVMARVASFIAPCFVANPNGDLFLAVVPENDERCNFYHVWWDKTRSIGDEPLRSEQLRFVGLDDATLKEFGMSPTNWDTSSDIPSRQNRYRQDRAMQAAGHFTGLPNFTQEDAVCSISSGTIRDRSTEVLSTADVAISRLYQSLLTCAKKVQAGESPTGLDTDISCVVGISAPIAAGADWRGLVPQHKRPNKPARWASQHDGPA